MIGAVVLAAGHSRRFGRNPKLAARLHGKPVLGHTLERLDAAPLRRTVVVTGAAHVRIAPIARAYGHNLALLRLVHNADFAAGMAGSLRRGLRCLPPACDFALIVLGDMPTLSPRLLKRLCANARPGVDVARPVCGTRPGHPVLISRRLFGPIDQLGGDSGARSVIANAPAHRRVEIQALASQIDDIDTPRALRRQRRTPKYRNNRPGPLFCCRNPNHSNS